MFGSVQFRIGAIAMSSEAETAKIKAELERLESAFEEMTDSRIREMIEFQIKECRKRLRQLQKLLRRA
jgi:protein subunit release factor A